LPHPSILLLYLSLEQGVAALATAVRAVAQAELSAAGDQETQPVVLIGRDTRPHSKELSILAARGVAAWSGRVVDLGLVSTPQLHYAVWAANAGPGPAPRWLRPEPGSVAVEEEFAAEEEEKARYAHDLSQAFVALMATSDNAEAASAAAAAAVVAPVRLVVDCSFGVGSLAMHQVAASIDAAAPGLLELQLRNEAYAGPVNEGCGAEHVQKNRVPPAGVDASADQVQQSLASFSFLSLFPRFPFAFPSLSPRFPLSLGSISLSIPANLS
jgi:phosphoacetylglucosamine mutase